MFEYRALGVQGSACERADHANMRGRGSATLRRWSIPSAARTLRLIADAAPAWAVNSVITQSLRGIPMAGQERIESPLNGGGLLAGGHAEPFAAPDDDRLMLDAAAIAAVRERADDGARMPAAGPWRRDLIEHLNGSLATELVCVLRYKRHHFTAKGLASPKIAEEFMAHANEESVHADRLARRIVELGGEPGFAPDSLAARSHAGYDGSMELRSMIKADLLAERVAIECYSQMIGLIGDKDTTTRRLLEEILADEKKYAEELQDWLAD